VSACRHGLDAVAQGSGREWGEDADGGCGQGPHGCQDICQRSNISYFTTVHSFPRLMMFSAKFAVHS